MKIGVIAANGKAGSLIVKEAVERGLDVTAIVREENKTAASKYIIKDLMNLNTEDLKEFDVVINAFGTWREDTLHLHSETLKHLSDVLSGTNTRLLVVGGAGSLYLDDTLTKHLFEADDFEEEYRPLASAMGRSLDELRKRNDVKWTYVSPAADFDFEGEKTGKYILAGEVFTVNSKGDSYISYADYAKAMVDEAVNGKNIGKRISVLGE
ncbi:NAD(P)-dependent oxidoreductase [Pseudostreptobacillus hongkongensis]|uniref:NAD(P)-dependent oxidoreductase n=1 Tax=Pseudostreptobacillus hongkongensis TaxID=1162717 RepID=UPI0008296BCE|nr:NAD(P)H-binding protein [Pseudostreptobacillus hongkongensis]